MERLESRLSAKSQAAFALALAIDLSDELAFGAMTPVQMNFVAQSFNTNRRLIEFCWVALNFEALEENDGSVDTLTFDSTLGSGVPWPGLGDSPVNQTGLVASHLTTIEQSSGVLLAKPRPSESPSL